ncbi:HD domain-containing phosphohydrolase [Nannocystaceae bacterium ST9]
MSLVRDFAGLLERLELEFEPAQIEHVAARSVRVRQRGAVVAVVEAGAPVPVDFDVILIVGDAEQLGAAIDRLGTARVQLLALPADVRVADQALTAAAEAAVQRSRADMVDRLLGVGVALVAERDPGKLLELILGEARRMVGADAGSIYVIEGPADAPIGQKRLRFRFAVNASVDTNFSEFTLPINELSVVGYCAKTGEHINIADLYADDPASSTARGRTFAHDRSFDRRFGYQTRSMLTVAMQPPGGEVLGVIQLINAHADPRDVRPLRTVEDFDRRVIAFDEAAEQIGRSLAAQGAVALENARLYAEIEALFAGFVKASVKAIEARDPQTSGHSERVASLTVELAKVVDRADSGELAAVRFDPQALREINYAALLHDFGKVGVREDVLVKAKKLHPGQFSRILARVEHMRTAERVRLLEAKLALAEQGRRDYAELEERFAADLRRVDELWELICTVNEPAVVREETSQRIRELADHGFTDGNGRSIRLLESDEFEALRIDRGSLTPVEREEIQSHVGHTYDFLMQIPWGRQLSGVPQIAGRHHEYLDGTGYYPEKIDRAPAIPIQTRMMTIADIFDALTSRRHYKEAMPLERALAILEAEVRAGKLDARLFEAFVAGRVFDAIALARD